MGKLVTGVAVAVLALVAGVALAWADLSPQGEPQRVNPDIAGDQNLAVAATASGGSFAVAYHDDADTIWLRRYGADGAPLAAPASVNAGSGVRSAPVIAAAPDGRMVLAYSYATSTSDFAPDVRAQRIGADGAAVGAELTVPVNTAGQQDVGAVAIAPDGSFVVTWSTTAGHVYARVFGADGTPASGDLQVDQVGYADRPVVAANADSFIVAWQRSTAPGDVGTLPARRFALADGTPLTDQFAAYAGAVNANYVDPQIGVAADGRAVLLFTGSDATRVRRLTAGGEPIGDAPLLDGNSVGSGRVVVAADGRFIAAWQSTAGSQPVRVRRFAPDGTPIDAAVTMADGATNTNPSLASDGDRFAVVAFTGKDGGGFNNLGVFVSRAADVAVVPPATTTTPPAPSSTAASTPPPTAASAPPPTTASTRPPVSPVVRVLGRRDVVGWLPSPRKCLSRRHFAIRLRVPHGTPVIEARVLVDGKRVAVRRGPRLRSTVDLRGLPNGTFSVAIVLVGRDGRTITGKRTYHTCVKKRRGRRPPRV